MGSKISFPYLGSNGRGETREKNPIHLRYPIHIRGWFKNGSSGTGYDKIKYEIKAIDTVIDRLNRGIYPRRSWRII